jgi:light-regulated signal transduction histidine kinase (bacteriophytochrome)
VTSTPIILPMDDRSAPPVEPAAGVVNSGVDWSHAAPALHPRWPLRVALAYFTFGMLWIFATDRLLQRFHLDAAHVLQFQTSKGWLFVIGSSLLIFFLLRAIQRRKQAVLAALVDSRNEIVRINAELEQRVVERTRQLEVANRELEAFAYAVSHDLRAPLRSMSGFSQILQETAPPELDEKSRHYLQRIHDASVRMSGLIEDLLSLSRVTRTALAPQSIDLTALWAEASVTVRERYPDRMVALTVAPDMEVNGDLRLLRIALENLLDNAWKYSAQRAQAQIEAGCQVENQERVFFIRDNGVGFDMAYANKLFWPFQRLHADSQFPGTGIGLVTVQRIFVMHGGRIWADAAPDRGATFFFTLG